MSKFNVDTTTPFNSGSRYDSASERSHKLDHSERYYGSGPSRDDYDTEEAYKQAVKKHNEDIEYKRKNVDPNLSHFNLYEDKILNGKSVYQNLYDRYHKFCLNHDIKQVKQGRLNRCYGVLNQRLSDKSKGKYVWTKDPTREYLKTRWLKPIRTLPFKLGDEKEKRALIDYCQSHGMSYEVYAKCINQGYWNYVRSFNAHNDYLKITNLHTNLDERGGDHGHMDYLALARTKNGRMSFSFNTAMKLSLSDYKGSDPLYKHPAKYNRHDLASAFVSHQVKSLHACMNKAFKAHGLDIQFTQVSHMHKGKYIKDLSTWQHQKDLNRELSQLLNSANKQNSKFRAENKILRNRTQYLESTNTTHAYNDLVDKSNQLIDNYLNPLVVQNQHLSALVSNLRYENQRLRKLNSDDIDILRGTPSWLEDLEHKQTVASELRLTHRQALQARLNKDTHNLSIMISNNNSWNHELKTLPTLKTKLNQLKNELNQLKDTTDLSPQFAKTLSKLANMSNKSLATWLIDCVKSEKKEQKDD